VPRLPLLLVSLLCIFATPLPLYAETKELTAEATYTMGEGETMTFAEAMALQKAKQMALEQAGTYVESFAKVQNYQLTAEEIQTITGGVLQVEVLEKNRTLVGDGLKHSVKIKATVTTDKVTELAKRIKGKNVAEEYKKLQEDYARLSKEIETWKQLIAKTPSGQERDAALDQIREREKAFSAVQKNEAAFFQRLVSGEALFSKALGQLSQKRTEKATVDRWFEKILEQGFVITIGEPDIHAALKNPQLVDISVPVTIKASEVLKASLLDMSRSLGSQAREASYKRVFREASIGALITRVGEDFETVTHLQGRIGSMVFVLELILDNGSVHACYIAPQFQMDGIPGYLGSLPLAPVDYLYSSGEIASLGKSTFLDKRLKSNAGFIAVFEMPTTFTAATSLQLDEAKRVKTVRGRVVEGTMEGALSYRPPTLPGTKPCEIQER
jgi:hypothetical protein